ncbi:hypothetical protein AB0I91_22835 [Actinosynnema sp. NPDC049800]
MLRAERRVFPGPAVFLADDAHRAVVAEYFADLAGSAQAPGLTGSARTPELSGSVRAPELSGQSYGEMAAALVAAVADGPVDLPVLAFSIHDLWPGRATATYLSHVCPGTPLSFAVCDQGSAAPFTALRLVRDRARRRALVVAVEQGGLPYDSTATPPREHRGVALLCGDDAGHRVTDLHQFPDVAPEAVPDLAARTIADLSAGHDRVRLVLGEALSAVWPEGPDRAPAGQPLTGVWWRLADALAEPGGLVVVGEYDRELRYLCLVGIEVR